MLKKGRRELTFTVNEESMVHTAEEKSSIDESKKDHSLRSQRSPYDVLAFYHIIPIKDPHEEVRAHKEFFKGRDVTSRIYLSEEGINGQMSAAREDSEAYMQWMHSREVFKDVHFKIHPYHEQAFPRLIVKYRKKLVAIDTEVDFTERGVHIEPEKWREMLESDKDYHLIDVRNDYEWKVGRFEGASLPNCNTFRQFEDYADKIENKDKPVMMYCTGGIRCELYSSILKKKGFDKVYQLKGGVINYGLKEGSKHWLGKLFVFDDRLTVPISEEEAPVIGSCGHCGTPSESYFNCANMDCNELFLSCQECIETFRGCCRDECISAPRVRPYQEQNPHKPFRRKHLTNFKPN